MNRLRSGTRSAKAAVARTGMGTAEAADHLGQGRSGPDRSLLPPILLGAIGLGVVAAASEIRRRKKANRWRSPSGSITHGSLVARSLGSSGPPVVLVHGMAGSQNYWGGDFDALSERARVVAVDLLGFGESRKPTAGYRPLDHADAVAQCLQELGIDQPAILVGHSMGTLVALALAKHHPHLVDRVLAIAPPIYTSRAAGLRHIRAMGAFASMAAHGSTSRVICRWLCDNRALASRLAPIFLPSLPPAIARAMVQHTWASYSQSLNELILSCVAPEWLETAARPVHLIAALDDPVPDLPLLSRLCELNDLVSLEIWQQGGHQLPLTQTAKCVAAIERAIAESAWHSTAASDGRHLITKATDLAVVGARPSCPTRSR